LSSNNKNKQYLFCKIIDKTKYSSYIILVKGIILYLEVEITAQPKAKKEKLAENIPYHKDFWHTPAALEYCWLCGTQISNKGMICRYCAAQFPIKKFNT
jgi:hypothetical protein